MGKQFKGIAPIIPLPLFIADIVILLSALITLFMLMLYETHLPLVNNGILLIAMSAVAFVVIVCWKFYIAAAMTISIISVALLIKQVKVLQSNIFNKIQTELIIVTFAMNSSLAIAFPCAARIRTGKPDMEPGLFFLCFNTAIICFLVIRIGAGLLAYYKNRSIQKI